MAELSQVILFVKRMDIMLSFYEGVLGLRRNASSNDSEEYVSLGTKASQLALHKIPEKYAKDIEIAEPPEARSATPINVTFKVDSVAEMRSQVQAQGLHMFEIQTAGKSSFCDGIDPEGNIFQISD